MRETKDTSSGPLNILAYETSPMKRKTWPNNTLRGEQRLESLYLGLVYFCIGVEKLLNSSWECVCVRERE